MISRQYYERTLVFEHCKNILHSVQTHGKAAEENPHVSIYLFGSRIFISVIRKAKCLSLHY